MDYASIESGVSHRQSKKFKQRLKYRLDQGYSYEEAFELASRKLSLLPTQGQTPVVVNSVNPSKYEVRKFRLIHSPDVASPLDEKSSAQPIVNFRPSEKSSAPDEKSSEGLDPLQLNASAEPSNDEVRRLVAELKTKGLMTEIPSLPKIVSEAGAAGKSVSHSVQVKPSFLESERLPWIISAMASAWLAIAMIESLSGPWFLNALVAISFAFGPMFILSPKLADKDRAIAKWGAIAIFTIDVVLFLLPSVQTIWNESTAYYSARQIFAVEAKDYQTNSVNAQALVLAAKSQSDDAEKIYRDALESYGSSNWRTGSAKKVFEQKYSDWERKSKDIQRVKAPEAPKLSQSLTEASQALSMRVGLFLVVYFLMFVRRQRI